LFFPLWGRRGEGERGRSRSSATVEDMYRSSKIYMYRVCNFSFWISRYYS
jgi:hypothetical protein